MISGEQALFEAKMRLGQYWTRAQFVRAMLVASGVAAQMAESMRKLHAASTTTAAEMERIARLLATKPKGPTSP